jgi:sigma-B regulation protein RsbU (phosphoserine phosphatase)
MVDPISWPSLERRTGNRRRTDPVKAAEALDAASNAAARVLVEHLFEQHFSPVSGIDVGTAYELADDNARVGGDLIDVYQFNNGSVAISIADISGKGMKAAGRAALVKYGLRAYVSSGLTPAQVLRNLNLLYLETSAFDADNSDSFVSVFLGIIDPERQVLTYACAGHSPVMFMRGDEDPISLPATAPIVGVFEESQKLFHQRLIQLGPETSTLVLGTDGLTEARSPDGAFIGGQAILARVAANRELSAQDHADDLLRATFEFCGKRPHDDIAIVVARFTKK